MYLLFTLTFLCICVHCYSLFSICVHCCVWLCIYILVWCMFFDQNGRADTEGEVLLEMWGWPGESTKLITSCQVAVDGCGRCAVGLTKTNLTLLFETKSTIATWNDLVHLPGAGVMPASCIKWWWIYIVLKNMTKQMCARYHYWTTRDFGTIQKPPHL